MTSVFGVRFRDRYVIARTIRNSERCCTCGLSGVRISARHLFIARLEVTYDPMALDAAPRYVVGLSTDQMTARSLAASHVRGSKAESDRLCELHSCNPLPLVLACMTGLGTPACMLVRGFGLDTLNVSPCA